jgi:hypothetical protein
VKTAIFPNQVMQECTYSLLIFTTKFNNSSILITIISWDYLNLSLANGYVGDASNIISVAPGASANQIAVFTSA